VRDYLGMSGKDVTDWRFVDFKEVPTGPWSLYGDNNTFVILKRRAKGQFAMDVNNLGRGAIVP
jgi:predicted transglutaminase-like cysteine proteinase